jgi:hypothetical protein
MKRQIRIYLTIALLLMGYAVQLVQAMDQKADEVPFTGFTMDALTQNSNGGTYTSRAGPYV